MTFQENIEEIRRQAREHMMEGAVTAAYRGDPTRVCQVLNDVLATELVCALRYRNNHFAALKAGAHRVAEEFLEHAAEEEQHRDMLAERITQLGGMPNFDPAVIQKRSHAAYTTSDDVITLLRENLIAERIAIASYAEIVRWLGDDDPTSRRVMEQILAQDVITLLRQNLIAERIAIASYAEIVRWLGDDDPTSRRVMEQILAQEEEHADDLVDLIQRAEARYSVES